MFVQLMPTAETPPRKLPVPQYVKMQRLSSTETGRITQPTLQQLDACLVYPFAAAIWVMFVQMLPTAVMMQLKLLALRLFPERIGHLVGIGPTILRTLQQLDVLLAYPSAAVIDSRLA
jgi:hypothetical protein